jgi:H+/Na+-translocating ferredoxin:NAD+ oxidoreductase subunit B
MSSTLIYTIISLSATGVVSAVILYFVAQRFKVYEDPRIDQVEDVLPSVNCGGCGYAGCRNFAEACIKSENLSGLFCPVGGNETMSKVAMILGMEAVSQDTKVAVVRCAGSYDKRPKINLYDGPASCAIQSSLYAGDTGCAYGCLGHGDCVEACDFDAIHMDLTTGLPVVTDEKCTACNACVVACPKHIIELRKRNKKDRKIFVSCINEEKGAIAKKSCEVACIGCSKCVKVCKFDAITLENYLAYIDAVKCTLCRKCVVECPTHSILEINLPPRKSQDGTDSLVDAEKVENV